MKGKKLIVLLLCIALTAGVFYILPMGLKQLEKSMYPTSYSDLVEQYAEQNQMDPLLVYSVIRTESGFDPNATSGVEARGLMQITEETFHWIKSKIAKDEDIDFDDLYDPKTNIRFGTYYFSRCLSRYENHVGTAAAAYHSGWGTVDKLLKDPKYSDDGKTLHTYPYEQMGRYVQKIDRAYMKYQKYYSNDENEV